MSSTTNMNAILGQGHSIKEVHNVKKQNLEMNQQFAAQNAEVKKKTDKARVRDTDAETRIADRDDEAKHGKKRSSHPKKNEKKRPEDMDERSDEGNLIDITV